MKNKLHIDNLEVMAFMDGLVFFSPVSLLIRTKAGLSLEQFFVLQAFLSIMIFVFEIPTGKITDKVGYKKTLVCIIFSVWKDYLWQPLFPAL